MAQRTCIECHADLPPKSRQDRIYCSKRCANRKHVIAWRKVSRDRRAEYFDRTCVTCGVDYRSARPTGKFCSDACKGAAYQTRCKLPDDHPVIRLIRESRPTPKAKAAPFREQRECAWCGTDFLATVRTQVNCTKRCKEKAIRSRRRGREHGSTSHYTWAEFMRLFISFDRRCAYCDERVDGQPDPDHVVPLSRGGSNGITNILPSCRHCNSDKRDLLLSEWSMDRRRRGLPARNTDSFDDPRWRHLTEALLAA